MSNSMSIEFKGRLESFPIEPEVNIDSGEEPEVLTISFFESKTPEMTRDQVNCLFNSIKALMKIDLNSTFDLILTFIKSFGPNQCYHFEICKLLLLESCSSMTSSTAGQPEVKFISKIIHAFIRKFGSLPVHYQSIQQN